jgi:hypothetical protein
VVTGHIILLLMGIVSVHSLRTLCASLASHHLPPSSFSNVDVSRSHNAKSMKSCVSRSSESRNLDRLELFEHLSTAVICETVYPS